MISSSDDGLVIGNTSTANLIEGNKIGTDITGTVSLYNLNGMMIVGASNTIGGTAAGAGNIISGNIGYGGGDPNTGWGLWLDGPAATENVVEGNLIGLDATGEHILGNTTNAGILVDGATDNTIGGTSADAANVISGNLRGIDINEVGATGNIIEGNLIGTDQSGTVALGNTGEGIVVAYAQANTIGGSAAGAGNVISGNVYGINILDGATDIVVQGNLIGLTSDGSAALGNSIDGIVLQGGTTGDTIGGTTGTPGTAAGNVISGNTDYGIEISNSGTTANVVQGNLIGTDITGTVAIRNLGGGVEIDAGVSGNTIGGLTATPGTGGGNVISGNNNFGINDLGHANVIAGNLIGLAAGGTVALANDGNGVEVNAGDTIGGTAAGAGNIISGNIAVGILVDGNDNLLAGNKIGTDVTGTAAIANSDGGVDLYSSSTGNTVGGLTASPGTGAGNLISGNNAAGIADLGGSNWIAGNLIGTDSNGTVALDNNGDGIDVYARGDTIGGTAAGAGNVISGNTGAGVSLVGSGATANSVMGNFIGTDITGTVAIANGGGVGLSSGASGNTIGGLTAMPGSGAGNVISGNDGVGIGDHGGSNVIAGNLIGLSASGTVALANGSDGMDVFAGGDTIGGTAAGAGNVISGNLGYGIYDDGANLIAGNLIGTDPAGTLAVPNDNPGIYIQAPGSTIGGSTAGAGNVISGNIHGGIIVTTSANLIEGNKVGTNSDGTADLANTSQGIILDAGGNTIGGLTATPGTGAGNLLTGNYGAGVASSGDNLIEGNLIGTDAAGTVALAYATDGIDISSDDTVGGTAAGAGNVISGNGHYGIYVGGSGNLVAGNKIGTDITGTVAITNGVYGIGIGGGATGNTIGGLTATPGTGAGNLISGNTRAGINDLGGSDLIAGNLIGTDAAGTVALANIGDGIDGSASGDTIVGTASGAGNVISGNTGDGVLLGGGDNLVAGNFIGTSVSGDAAIGNGGDGVRIRGGSSGNTIGGLTATPGTGAGNVISGNTGSGIYDANGSNWIAGNLIGVSVSGTTALANDGYGIFAFSDTIGGTAAGSGNVISGNGLHGIDDAGSNLIAGNLIGTDISGTVAVLGSEGILSVGTGSTIGGTTAGAGNVISGDSSAGISLYIGATGNLVEGNKIGTIFDGSAALGNDGDGIDIYARDNTIGGTTAGAGNVISGNDGRGVYDVGGSNLIAGNFIGLSAGGTVAVANVGDGIIVEAGSDTIGGTTAAAGNVISGNAYGGVEIVFSASNLIEGNLIGTDAAGTVAIGNGGDGVDLGDAATGNTIGGSAAGAGNLISGNAGNGVQIFNSGTTGNLVEGNLIGTDITGTVAIPNGTGVSIDSFASGNTIGGLTATPGTGAGNVISGNSGAGIEDSGGSNVIAGNLIGLSASGTVALANDSDGIDVDASGDTIGGTAAGAGNVISGNSGAGVDDLAGSNLIEGNLIGTDVAGTAAVANNGDGVDVGWSGDTIGGTTAGARNVISGNTGDGVALVGEVAQYTLVEGNFIGTDSTGTIDLGNNSVGVLIKGGATQNTIGGTAPGASNVISGNVNGGLSIDGSGNNANLVEGNFIGTDHAGTNAVGVQGFGVLIERGAAFNTIGGTAAGAGNLIAVNTGDGVIVSNGYQDFVQGNRIGLNASGTAGLGNSGWGISVVTNGQGTSSGSNVIGGTGSGAGNVVSGNAAGGILVAGGIMDLVAGNYVGVDPTGTFAISNFGDGIQTSGGTGDTIGGNAAGAGNLISGNTGDGVEIESSGEVVAGNMIGTDITGTVALPNDVFGVVVTGGSNTIGGTVAAAQNLISGNMSAGIQISSSTATDNVVEGNSIGTTLDGAQALANGGGPGVVIEYFATGNTIGGTTAGAANLISGNTDGGVIIYGHGTIDNVVAGNLIGTNDDGTLAVAGETGAGVKIYGGAAQNTIGGTASGAGNLISGNEGDGVRIDDGYQDFVQGNRIGLDRSGTAALANTADGISLSQHFPSQTTSGYTSSGPGSHTGSNVIGGTGSGAERRLGELNRRNLYQQWNHGPGGGKLRRGQPDRHFRHPQWRRRHRDRQRHREHDRRIDGHARDRRRQCHLGQQRRRSPDRGDRHDRRCDCGQPDRHRLDRHCGNPQQRWGRHELWLRQHDRRAYVHAGNRRRQRDLGQHRLRRLRRRRVQPHCRQLDRHRLERHRGPR